jgi:hypothetical protein
MDLVSSWQRLHVKHTALQQHKCICINSGCGASEHACYSGKCLGNTAWESHCRSSSRIRLQWSGEYGCSSSGNAISSPLHVLLAVAMVLSFTGTVLACLLLIYCCCCRGATQGLKMVGEYFPWTSGQHWTCSRAVPAGGVSDTAVGTVSKCGPVSPDATTAAPQSSHFVYLR